MNKKYVPYLILGLLAAVIVTIMTLQERKFQWTTTFSHTSDEPFGCAIFDSIMTETLPGGYEVADDISDSIDAKHTAIIYAKESLEGEWNSASGLYYDSLEYVRMKKLKQLAIDGAVVVVAFCDFNSINDEFSIPHAIDLERKENTYYYRNTTTIQTTIEKRKEEVKGREKVKWNADGRMFEVEDFMLSARNLVIYMPIGKYEVLATYDYVVDDTLTVTHEVCYTKRYPSGGQIVFVATPLLLTNYALLDGSTGELTMRVLSSVGKRHVVRVLGVNPPPPHVARKNRQQLGYLLSQPPLRWALYLTITVLILFCIFNGSRKRRAIPMPQEANNATLSFAKFLGTFYFHRRNHKNLVLKKYEQLERTLKMYYDWNVEQMSTEQLSRRLAELTGLSDYLLERLLSDIKFMRQDEVTISQEEMMKYIDKINEIQSKLQA